MKKDYLKELDAAFKAAREEYMAAYAEYERAENGRRSADAWSQEKYFGEKAAKKAQAEGAFKEAVYNLRKVCGTAWGGLQTTVDKLRRELAKDVARAGAVDPDAVDMNGVKLLELGGLSAADFAAMYDRYTGNHTMQRMVISHARKAAAGMKDNNQERQTLNVFCYAHRSAENDVAQRFDALADIADVCSGRIMSGTGRDIKYPHIISQRWEELTANIL